MVEVSRLKAARGKVGAVVGLVALALAGGALPAQGQSAPSPPPARSIEAVCPAGIPDAGFLDVTEDNLHGRAIDCVVAYGIASGRSTITYAPDRPVHRDQMATFVAGLIDAVGESDPSVPQLPAGAADPFPCDLEGSESVHLDNIARLAAAGVVSGGPGGRSSDCYGPELLVTRDQMATFVHKALVFLGVPIIEGPSASFADYYVDDDGSDHERNINAITSEAIAGGVGQDASGRHLYLPRASVRRDQMATFLTAALSYVAEPGIVVTPPSS